MARDVVFEKQKPIAAKTVTFPMRSSCPLLPPAPVKTVGIIPCYSVKQPDARPRGIPGQRVQVWDKEKKEYARGTIKNFMRQYNQWIYCVLIDGKEDTVWTNNLI